MNPVTLVTISLQTKIKSKELALLCEEIEATIGRVLMDIDKDDITVQVSGFAIKHPDALSEMLIRIGDGLYAAMIDVDGSVCDMSNPH